MASGAAAAIAAAVARARREILEHFEDSGAFDLGNAVSYEPPDHIHERQFELLVGRGILQPVGDGRYWIDREAERLEDERRRSAAMLLFKLVLIAVALSLAGVAIVTALH
jgi:hypothetical protein